MLEREFQKNLRITERMTNTNGIEMSSSEDEENSSATAAAALL